MLQYNLEHQSINIGDHYGKLTVIDYLGLRKQKSRDKNAAWYLCQCDCGSKPIEVMGNLLITGQKKSCGCLVSAGELKIRNILDEHNIKYKTQYTFDDLIISSGGILRFDFAIFDKDELLFLIEYDGRQHYDGPEAKWTQSASLEVIQQHDNQKNKYCKEHNIILKRIPYYDYLNITYEKIMSTEYNI